MINTIKKLYFFIPKFFATKKAFNKIKQQFKDKEYDIIFILPWLVQGGVELVALNFINTLSNQFKQKILVITTLKANHVWKERLSVDVDYFDFSVLTSVCNPKNEEKLLYTLLTELNIHKIHVMNSDLGWRVFKKYGAVLSKSSSLYASIFADGISTDGKLHGYAQTYLKDTEKYLTCLVSDNNNAINCWSKQMALPKELFQVIRTPIHTEVSSYQGVKNRSILWASRLTHTKRPDLLLKIAQELPEFNFEVFGVAEGMNLDTLKSLQTQANITLHGSYNGFHSIMHQHYFLCFLYTSESDGMPNALLEAIAHGLCVIASDVGGIAEIINSDTGYLVRPFDEVKTYVQCIRHLYDSSAEAQAKWQNAYKIICSQFNEDTFQKNLNTLYQL